jgi:hypothetical protein
MYPKGTKAGTIYGAEGPRRKACLSVLRKKIGNKYFNPLNHPLINSLEKIAEFVVEFKKRRFDG